MHVTNVGRAIAATVYTQRHLYTTLECIMYNQMCIFCYVHLPDRGLVETEICWSYVNVNNKLLQTKKYIWLDSIK